MAAPKDPDRDLLRNGLEQEGLIDPAPPPPEDPLAERQRKAMKPGRRMVTRRPLFLTPKEELWVETYLATGSSTEASRAIGEAQPEKHANRMLHRPLVRERLNMVISERNAAKVTMTRQKLMDKAVQALQEWKPFERVKVMEFIAKMEGHAAPQRQIRELRKQEVSQYAEVAETLRATGEKLTKEERYALRAQLLADHKAIEEVLAQLDELPPPAAH